MSQRPQTNHELDIVYQTMNTKWITVPEQWRWLSSDKQMCKAIYSYGDWKLQPETWSRLQTWLEPLLSSGISYTVRPTESDGKGNLHFTFHQITRFFEAVDLKTDFLNSAAFQIFMKQIEGLQIQFRGLVVTPTGLALRGFPANDAQLVKLTRARDRLGAFLESHGITFQPSYCNDICHATLFRWTREPTESQIQHIQTGLSRWEEAFFGTCMPTIWGFGHATLLMNYKEVVTHTTAFIPLQIAHRGLTEGPDANLENNWSRIQKRVKDGLYSEVDVWYDRDTNQWSIGHDEPQTPVALDALLNPFLWLHAKNKDAFDELLKKRYQGHPIQVFWHTTEDYCLTTNLDCIVYPGKPLLMYSTFMMPERAGSQMASKASCICSDWLDWSDRTEEHKESKDL